MRQDGQSTGPPGHIGILSGVLPAGKEKQGGFGSRVGGGEEGGRVKRDGREPSDRFRGNSSRQRESAGNFILSG